MTVLSEEIHVQIENIRESLEPADQKGRVCIDTLAALESAQAAWERFG